ncbi:nuclear transport factor 2 family protein [Pseudonocardia acidicola]|uniref:Nuclear transport factor 2 family protein n=1 Tax=Pseudonocardia acidicola TaxID=2724939 RepID=A0ABX1SLH1_9PSEU|nr:nuclear transport factor 2 family protein [Pseudonocardia acidicola]NMI01120.1 nuclear transport factor 2 family protein [Pseudonocardia acidicola]
MTLSDTLDAVARLELHELYARYTHAFDEGRSGELAQLFTADGEFVRPGAEPVRGRAALAELVTAAAARGTGNRHLVSSMVVEAGGRPGTARGTAYVQVVGIGEDAVRLVAIGRYDDEFAREDGRWAFRSRRFTSFTGSTLAGAILASNWTAPPPP